MNLTILSICLDRNRTIWAFSVAFGMHRIRNDGCLRGRRSWLKIDYPIVALTAGARVLDYDQIFTGGNERCLPELGSEIYADNLGVCKVEDK